MRDTNPVLPRLIYARGMHSALVWAKLCVVAVHSKAAAPDRLVGATRNSPLMFTSQIAAAGLIAAALVGCDKPSPPVPEIRPVRTAPVQRSQGGEPISLTGQIS